MVIIFEAKKYLGYDVQLNYIIDYPKNFDVNKKYPLIFYIHGLGFVGNDIQKLMQKCPVRREYITDNMPFIIVAPQSPCNTWFEILQDLMRFMKSNIDLPYVDKNKVYLTGSSMGGYTCWALSFIRKDWFAAAIICCGGGMTYSSRFFSKMPIKAVHGFLDTIVPVSESERMAKAVNDYGGNVELVIYDNEGHNVWDKVFTDNKFYKWLFSKKIN